MKWKIKRWEMTPERGDSNVIFQFATPPSLLFYEEWGRELKSHRLEAFHALTQADNIWGEQADDGGHCELCLDLIRRATAHISCLWLGFSIFPS